MDENTLYSIEFLPTAVQDLTEIISMFIMLGSKQGAVRINSEVVSDKALKVGAGTMVVQVGKRRFAKVELA